MAPKYVLCVNAMFKRWWRKSIQISFLWSLYKRFPSFSSSSFITFKYNSIQFRVYIYKISMAICDAMTKKPRLGVSHSHSPDWSKKLETGLSYSYIFTLSRLTFSMQYVHTLGILTYIYEWIEGKSIFHCLPSDAMRMYLEYLRLDFLFDIWLVNWKNVILTQSSRYGKLWWHWMWHVSMYSDC